MWSHRALPPRGISPGLHGALTHPGHVGVPGPVGHSQAPSRLGLPPTTAGATDRERIMRVRRDTCSRPRASRWASWGWGQRSRDWPWGRAGLPSSPQYKPRGLAVAGAAFRDRSPCPAPPVPTQPQREAARRGRVPTSCQWCQGCWARDSAQRCKGARPPALVPRSRQGSWAGGQVLCLGSEHGPPAPSHGRAPLDTSQLTRASLGAGLRGQPTASPSHSSPSAARGPRA